MQNFKGQGGGRVDFCQGSIKEDFKIEDMKNLIEKHLSSWEKKRTKEKTLKA